MPTCGESCQTLAPGAGIVPDNRATCRRHHKPTAQHMCHHKHRRGWRQAGQHQLQRAAYVGSLAALPPLGIPSVCGGSHRYPTREAPGKRRLVPGKDTLPCGQEGSCSPASWMSQETAPRCPVCGKGLHHPAGAAWGPPPGRQLCTAQVPAQGCGIPGRAECPQPPRFTRVSLEPWRNAK